MDRLVAILTGSVPSGLVEILREGGLDLGRLLRLQPLAELFVLARKARKWNRKQAAAAAGVPQKAIRALEEGDGSTTGPWVLPYAVQVGMTALLGEWIQANPALAAELGWPPPNQLAGVFGALMHSAARQANPAGNPGGPRDMFVAPDGFAERFDPARMRVAVGGLFDPDSPSGLADLAESILEVELGAEEAGAEPPSAVPSAPATYQFKVSLNHVRPPVWRRFTVPSDLTFARLHEVVQAVMGWANAHLHDFEVGGRTIGRPDPDWPRPVLPEDKTRLADVGLRPRAKLTYRYDFGDDWEHTLVLEKILPADPAGGMACLAGRRACPPEDCGSVPGYEEICALLADPQRKDPDGLREWAEDYDPEAFDLAEVNLTLAALAARWQRKGGKRRRGR